MAWYYIAPGLSWNAMLKHTKVEIELLTDYEKLLFVVKAFVEAYRSAVLGMLSQTGL